MLILTPTFLKYLKIGFTFCQKFHAHPFYWDEETNGPRLCGWGNGLGVWYVNLTFAYSGFLVRRLVQVHTKVDEEGNLK